MKKKSCLLFIAITLLVQFAGPAPAAAQSPGDIARQYLLPGETLYTFPYPLREGGQEYYLHFYLINYPNPSEQLISYLPTFINGVNFKALLVTTNGQVVEDREKLAALLTLWQAGYQLYRVRAIPPVLNWVDTESFAQDMNLVMLDPLFAQQMIVHLAGGKSDRYRLDAWKGILHSEINPPGEWEEAGEQVKDRLDGALSIQDAVDATVDASYNIVGRGHKIPALLKDARRMYKGWNPAQTGYGGQAVYTKNETASSQNSAAWSLTIPDAGYYRANAYIPAKAPEIPLPYTGAAHYEIKLPSGGKAVKTSQAASEGAWLNLGEFYVEAGQTVTIQLYDQTGERAGTKAVIFDAVQWIPERSAEPLVLRHNLIHWPGRGPRLVGGPPAAVGLAAAAAG